MLKLNKEEVHFLVTAEMKKEVADFLEAVDAKIAPVLEYIKENQVERVCFIGCGSSSAAGSTAKYLADKYTTLTVNAYTGWEFVDSMPVYGDRKTLAVFISQSGTTEEIVEGLRKARNQGFMTVGVCNKREDNPLGIPCRGYVGMPACCAVYPDSPYGFGAWRKHRDYGEDSVRYETFAGSAWTSY